GKLALVAVFATWQILQGTLVVSGSDMSGLTPDFPHSGLSFLGTAPPLVRVHEVTSWGGTWDAVGGARESGASCPGTGCQRTLNCSAQGLVRPKAKSDLGLNQLPGSLSDRLSLFLKPRLHGLKISLRN